VNTKGKASGKPWKLSSMIKNGVSLSTRPSNPSSAHIPSTFFAYFTPWHLPLPSSFMLLNILFLIHRMKLENRGLVYSCVQCAHNSVCYLEENVIILTHKIHGCIFSVALLFRLWVIKPLVTTKPKTVPDSFLSCVLLSQCLLTLIVQQLVFLDQHHERESSERKGKGMKESHFLAGSSSTSSLEDIFLLVTYFETTYSISLILPIS
jgi:hypothetical protein